MVGCFEANKSIRNDRSGIRKRQRICILQCEDLKELYNREHNMRECVSVLHYVQYSKNISHHRGINATPCSVHFGRTPLDISVNMSLPREAVQPLETEDQLEQASTVSSILAGVCW